MDWRRILSYITGAVDEELRLRNEYLAAENRILRSKIPGRVPLDDADRATLARIAKRLGLKALGELARSASSRGRRRRAWLGSWIYLLIGCGWHCFHPEVAQTAARPGMSRKSDDSGPTRL